NLSQLFLGLGEIQSAIASAKDSIELADISEDRIEEIIERTALADALHQGGNVTESLRWFEEAEQIQGGVRPSHPRLNSLQGFQYCDLLLAMGESKEVARRVKRALEGEPVSLLAAALDHLTLSRTLPRQ